MNDLTKIKVIKRNGKKVPFNLTKITIGIRNAFFNTDSTLEMTDDEKSLAANNVITEVTSLLTSEIQNKDSITVQELSELVERILQKCGYLEVYNTYTNYRKRREASREAFSDEKKLHKFLKSIEELSLKDASSVDAKRENANVDGNTSMGTMLQYGSTISKEFAKTYLMKPTFSDAHDEGYIHIHDLDFAAMGTTTCMQIDLDKLFKNGFNTGHGYLREPNSIISYAALAAIAVQSNQNDQHGGQAIPALDFFLAPGVLKTFKKEYKKNILNLLEFNDYKEFINEEKLFKKIDNLKSISFNIDDFKDFYNENKTIKSIFDFSYKKALEQTDKQTHQAMEAFIHNLNSMHSRAGSQVPFSSVSFGTDISPEGRMVTKNFLLAAEEGLGRGETPIFPVSIFKVKEGVNYNEEDTNYDLFKLACRVSAKRLFPNFSFLDAPFNKQYYKEGDWKSEVAYMGCAQKDEIITYKFNDELYIESFHRAFKRISESLEIKQYGVSKYIDTTDKVLIYDTNKGFVNCKKIIKNPNKDNWYNVTLEDGRILTLTEDHPLATNNGRKFVKNLNIGERVYVTYKNYSEETINKSPDKAWFSGYKIPMSGFIPNEVFKYNQKAKLAFIAGALDSFGVNITTEKENYLQFTSNLKELMLQLVYLVQSFGYPAFIYKDSGSND